MEKSLTTTANEKNQRKKTNKTAKAITTKIMNKKNKSKRPNLRDKNTKKGHNQPRKKPQKKKKKKSNRKPTHLQQANPSSRNKNPLSSKHEHSKKRTKTTEIIEPKKHPKRRKAAWIKKSPIQAATRIENPL
nr:hypothetical protein [Enterococcus faecium]